MSNLPPNPWRFLRVRWVSLIFAVLAALGLSAVGSARADTVTPPSAGQMYGASMGSLPQSVVAAPTSGWTQRQFAAFGQLTNAAGSPYTVTFSEPVAWNGFVKVPVFVSTYNIQSPTPLTDFLMQGSYGPDADHAKAVVTCSNSQWSTAATQFPVVSYGAMNRSSIGVNDLTNFQNDGAFSPWAGFDQNSCPYLVSIVMPVGFVTNNHVGVYTWVNAVWLAQDWVNGKTYGGVSSIVAHCASYLPDDRNARVECNGVVVPAVAGQHSNPDTWCNGAPVPVWPSLDFGAFVSYFAKCLTIPQNGIDSENMVAAAIAATGVPAFVDTVSAIPAGIMVTGTCGPLWNAPTTGYLVGFSVDTCSWSWASQFRTLVGIGLQAGFAFFVIRWVFDGVNGMIGTDWRAPIWDGEKK